MRIALLGYGKMGKTIERIGLGKGYVFPLKIDENNAHTLTQEELKACDVAIEFSAPEVALRHLRFCIESGVPIVCGTTGWQEHRQEIENLCVEKNGSMLCSSNFSVGVNIFFELTAYAAAWMKKWEGMYAASITEIHHTEKKDSPSGTAISLAEEIIRNSSYKKWRLESAPSKDESDVIPIKSIREKDVVGVHDVCYESKIDAIKLSHVAHNRDGFAVGALIAAAYVRNKKGVYSMKDALKEQLSEGI